MGSGEYVQGRIVSILKPPAEPEELSSSVMPAVRRISATKWLSDRQTLERLVCRLTEQGLQAYRDAATARAAGDLTGAMILTTAAQKALDVARIAQDEIHGLLDE